MKRTVGRPSKLTADTKEKLTTALVAGCSIRDSCIYAGISERIYHTWAEKALTDLEQNKTTEHTQFLQDVTRAQGLAKPRLEILLSKAAERDPRITLEILARRYPNEWSRKDNISFRDRTGEPDDIVSKLPDDELVERAKKIIADLGTSA